MATNPLPASLPMGPLAGLSPGRNRGRGSLNVHKGRLLMWSLVYLAVAAWALLKIASTVRKRVKNSTFPYRKHWALALAQPMVEAQGLAGFSSPDSTELAETARSFFAPA